MKRTLLLIIAILAGTAIASLIGCASGPDSTKMLPTFSVGDRVAFNVNMAVWSKRSTPQEFEVHVGDTGVIVDVLALENEVLYHVALDKAGPYEKLLSPAYETKKFNFLIPEFYPDPALAPKGKQKE